MTALLTVDLDDTVWPCEPAIRAAEQALFDWLSARASRLTAVYDIESLRAHRREVMRAHPAIAHDLTAVRLTSLRQLLTEYGYDPGLADLAGELFLEHRSRVTPFADVSPVLRALRDRYCLISVSNGNASVELTPLKGQFHFSLNAADVGEAKPGPALFLQAMSTARVPPSAAIHVGDDPVRDVAAARSVGMRTAWVNRNARPWPQDLEPPDAEVADFFGLQRWLVDAVCTPRT